MKTKYNRFALLPFHCTDCHRYIWLEPYRRADVFIDYIIVRHSVKKSICKDCLKNYNVKGENK